MSHAQSGTTPAPLYSKLTKPILIAGILGGVLGGIISFAATRFIKPATPTAVKSAKDEAVVEARDVVEQFIALIRAGKTEEFLGQVKMAYTFLSEERFKEMSISYQNARITYERIYGKPLNQFDLIREAALCPDMVQFLYLERYEHGGPIWRFVMYRAIDRWRISLIEFREPEQGIIISLS